MYKLDFFGRHLTNAPLFSILAAFAFTFFLIQEQSTSGVSLNELQRLNDTQNKIKHGADYSPPNEVRPPDLSEEALLRGLDFSHLQQSHGVTGLDETLGSGLCVLDFNKDTYPDLFAVGGSGHTRFYGRESWWSAKQGSRLYQNDGRGYFRDVSDKLDLPPGLWGMGCGAADLNEDGFVDLVVTSRTGIHLLRNYDGRRFESEQLYQNKNSWPTSVAIADINNDYLPDIYITNYLNYDKTAKRFEGVSGYRQATPSSFQPNFYQGQSNLLFINNGRLKFEESAAALNLDISEGRSLSAYWLHANGDNYVDLLIVNDIGSTTQLYINQNGQTFTKADLSRHLDLPSGTRSAAINDFDDDGDTDIALSTMSGESPVLLMNDEGEFTNVTWTQLDSPEKLTGMSSYGTALLDINNDGYLDLLFNNGFTGPDSDSYYVPQGQPNVLALNNGKGHFSPLLPASQAFAETLSSRSIVTADFDSDGDIDFAISNNNGPLQLVINKTPNPNWTGFDFSPSDYLQAVKITLHTTHRELTRFTGTATLLGSHGPRINFALSPDEKAESATINWRDGSKTRYSAPSPARYHQVSKRQVGGEYSPDSSDPFRPLPLRLALWKIISDKAATEELARSFLTYDAPARKAILEAIGEHQPGAHLATIKLALEDQSTDIKKKAIDLLIHTENDNSLHWLQPLFTSSEPEILCAIAEGYRHLFIEEEAAVMRKNLAITALIRLLEHRSTEVQSCTLGALGESKSFRPVNPVVQLLGRTSNPRVIENAYRALGELRRTHSATALKQQLPDHNLQKKLELALRKTEGKLTHKEQEKHLIPAITADNLAKKLRNTNDTVCIRMETSQLKDLHAKQLASLFSACSRQQIHMWFTRNISFIRDNYRIFLDNRWVSDSVISSLLESLSENPPSGFIDLIHTHLKNNDRHTPALISGLSNYPIEDSLYVTLGQIFRDVNLPKETRLLAGDILVQHDGDLVLSYSETLFYEN